MMTRKERRKVAARMAALSDEDAAEVGGQG